MFCPRGFYAALARGLRAVRPVVPRHLASGLLALIVLLSARTLQAQIMLATPLDASSSAPPQQTGFTIPTDESLLNSFADFQRHVERKAWEKAFATLNEIPAESAKACWRVRRGHHSSQPAHLGRDRVAPAEGRDAFRLFHEAKARQTWSTIDQGSLSWSEQLATADKVYQEFFLSSVGDNAADFLGDAAFEQEILKPPTAIGETSSRSTPTATSLNSASSSNAASRPPNRNRSRLFPRSPARSPNALLARKFVLPARMSIRRSILEPAFVLRAPLQPRALSHQH